ncbi:hypothetical protein [Nitrosococcus wardiae]|uniref:Uncharacterized protein n=1 Tax=Nitrosococcus wardiae TaxID=1814290 RepID=A0A4P7C534_9GAMM|nr:hypothetical protein [Nitrosococcus wardiae]QBQ56086.1 hypothetical protein E3U44_17395 [Nitrosococcus wardiae]
MYKYLSKSFEVFRERADGVEPEDREVPAPIAGSKSGHPEEAPQGARIKPFFREEKRVCGTSPARS